MSERLVAEVAVVGAGPAGIAAACRAAEQGARVVLVDEGLAAGGQIWRRGRGAPPPRMARRWLGRLRTSGTKLMTAATVLEAEPSGVLWTESQGKRLAVQAGQLILATGARELFLPFPGWTLPGVVGVGAVQALIKSGVRFSGRRVVLAGSGPLLLPVAAALSAQGARLAVVAEQAPSGAVFRFCSSLWRQPGKLWQAMRYRGGFLGCAYRAGVWPLAAQGDEVVEEVMLTDGRRRWGEPCEILACSHGLEPNVELACRLGCALQDGCVVVDEDQRTSVAGVLCAGEPTGVGGAELAVVEGEIAGLTAVGREKTADPLKRRRNRLQKFAVAMRGAFAPRQELAERLAEETIVCRCEDVVWGGLQPSWNLRQAKLYTRVGMGPCQGRVCGAALKVLLGWSADSVRPPLKPCAVGTLPAGGQKEE